MDWQKEVTVRQEKMIQLTRTFLQFKSILDEKTATEKAPFGKEIDEALRYLLQLGETYNLKTKNVDGYAGLIEYGDGEESVGVLCHIDVVPANGNGWVSPPFSAEIKEGAIIARGAMDNKGPTMAAFFALALLKELGVKVSKRIQLIIGTDEESHWRCVEHYFKHEEMPVIGFAPDADFPIIHAEKGILDVMLTWPKRTEADVKKESAIKLIQLSAGERLNMVPDEAFAYIKGEQVDLEIVKDKYERYLENKGMNGQAELNQQQLKLSCYGKAAHGSTPEEGHNAGLALACFLSKEVRLQEGGSSFLTLASSLYEDFYAHQLGITMKDEVSGRLTINPGLLTCSENGEAKMGLNIRYPVTSDGQVIIQKLAKVAREHDSDYDVIDHMEPNYVEKEDELIQILQTVYERHTGEKAELLAIGGGTYARALKKGVAFGPLFPGREDLAHQKNESILIEDFIKMTAIYADAMYELAK